MSRNIYRVSAALLLVLSQAKLSDLGEPSSFADTANVYGLYGDCIGVSNTFGYLNSDYRYI